LKARGQLEAASQERSVGDPVGTLLIQPTAVSEGWQDLKSSVEGIRLKIDSRELVSALRLVFIVDLRPRWLS